MRFFYLPRQDEKTFFLKVISSLCPFLFLYCFAFCTHLKFPRRVIELEIASGKIKVYKRKDETFLKVNNDIFSIM